MSVPSFDWRRVLVYTHRWLGICGMTLFVSWFVSGIVLMYAGMPALSPAERLHRMRPLDLSAATLSPHDVARASGVTPDRVHVAMLHDRPVYRFSGRGGLMTVFADDGERVDRLTGDSVMSIVAGFAPEHAASLKYDRELSEPDQWTLQSRRLMPLHRVALGDGLGTTVYVSDRTAEPMMKTTRRSRRLAYAGAVLHWLYFTPIRRHGTLWLQSVLWLSIIGCGLCLTGLTWGIWRWSTGARYRLRGGPSATPYAGLMRWHHYAGLVFGLTTFTWIFSGALSLEPWNWHPSNSATAEQRLAVSGGALSLHRVTLDRLRSGVDALKGEFAPNEIEIRQFQGEPILLAFRPPADAATGNLAESRLVSAIDPESGVFSRFDQDRLLDAARAALPGVSVSETVWLEQYDSYYYGRHGSRPLPVLRLRFDDPRETWLYLDPRRGEIVLREERLTRINRWLYHGLHSLDFPFLYARRPLWDVIVITLSLGGIGLSVTTIAQSWRRLKRHGRRLRTFLP